jgi:hypothetical protein
VGLLSSWLLAVLVLVAMMETADLLMGRKAEQVLVRQTIEAGLQDHELEEAQQWPLLLRRHQDCRC